ncbi:MAG TPA: hypothetical protein VFM34_07165 [Moraxellaceae bacterium]|nr:hypothetical protein [Moraxellaceae bacterium]
MRYLSFAFAALLAATPFTATAAVTPAPSPAPAATASPVAPDADATEQTAQTGPWVYMVARINLTGTDLTQVIFFSHPAIVTLDDCEAERAAGLTTGWVHLNRQYFRTLKGVAYKVEYRCVESGKYLAPWRTSDIPDRFYLVRTTDTKLELQPAKSFFVCRDHLHKFAREETIDAFCAKASQAVLDTPPPAATGTTGPAPAAATPAAESAPAPAPAPAPSPASAPAAHPWD